MSRGSIKLERDANIPAVRCHVVDLCPCRVVVAHHVPQLRAFQRHQDLPEERDGAGSPESPNHRLINDLLLREEHQLPEELRNATPIGVQLGRQSLFGRMTASEACLEVESEASAILLPKRAEISHRVEHLLGTVLGGEGQHNGGLRGAAGFEGRRSRLIRCNSRRDRRAEGRERAHNLP